MHLEDLWVLPGDDDDDLSDTEADMTEFAKAANGNGGQDLSDTEADITQVQEGEHSE